MNGQALDLFAGAVNEIANGPKVTNFQGLTESLLRRLSEKGLTLEQCTDRRMLNRPAATLKGHCTRFGIRFPDFTPANMRRHVQFVPSGDYLELTGDEVEAVAAALSLVVTNRDGRSQCAIPIHGWTGAKSKLRTAGYEARKAKAPKKRKAVTHA